MAIENSGHFPVMLPEVLASIAPKDGQVIIDCTFGGGGYSCAFLNKANCKIIGLDRDPTAIARGMNLKSKYGDKLQLIETPFSKIGELGLFDIDAIIMDIGVSSFQIDQAERGFSFMRDGPLDMRMGDGETAAQVLATHSEADLAKIFWEYGEEKNARRIARAIVNDRPTKPYETTLQLAGLCERVYGHTKEKIHPATRVFQALRIYVNDELGELETALENGAKILKKGGVLGVVTFHSLEDRIVKNFMNSKSKPEAMSRFAPINHEIEKEFELLSRKPILPSQDEIAQNPRSRSAKLRVMRRK